MTIVLPVDDRGGPRPQAGPARPHLRPAGTLQVLDGPDRGRAGLAPHPGDHLLGGSPHCELPLTDPDVSRWIA